MSLYIHPDSDSYNLSYNFSSSSSLERLGGMSWYERYNQNAMFDPSGRLRQVESAFEAPKRGATTLAIRTRDCIVLVTNAREGQKPNDEPFSKFHKISNNIICGGCGHVPDAHFLINHARQEALRHKLVRHREIPCSRLSRRISELMAGYTQYTHLRPFGVKMLFAGYDEDEGFQIFTSDPAGTLVPHKAVSFGYDGELCQVDLKTDYSFELTTDEAREVAVKTVKGYCEASPPNPADFQIVIMKKSLDGALQIDYMTQDKMNEALGNKIFSGDEMLDDDELLGVNP